MATSIVELNTHERAQDSLTDASDFIDDARAIADLMTSEGDEAPGTDPEVIRLRRAAMTLWRLLGQAQASLEAGMSA